MSYLKFAIATLAAITLTACSNAPDRSKSAELINKHFQSNPEIIEPLTIETIDAAELLMNGGVFHNNTLEKDKPQISRLQKNGIIDIKFGQKYTKKLSHYGIEFEAISYSTKISQEVAKYVISEKSIPNGRIYTVSKGKVEEVLVTGLTEAPNNSQKVEFTFKFRRPDFSQKYSNEQEIRKYKGSATLKKFDDGWRIVEFDV